MISQSKIVVSRVSIIKKIKTPYYWCDCNVSIDIVHEDGSIIYVCTNENTIAEDYSKHLLSLRIFRRCCFRDLSTWSLFLLGGYTWRVFVYSCVSKVWNAVRCSLQLRKSSFKFANVNRLCKTGSLCTFTVDDFMWPAKLKRSIIRAFVGGLVTDITLSVLNTASTGRFPIQPENSKLRRLWR